jgi:hypothetical protein
MINFRNQVPSVYTDASRDFQYLSWLINIVLNYVKHNVDDIYDLPNTDTDARITELLAMTLGFKVKRSYNQKQLAALVSILPSILKYKGTKRAVEMAGFALINASRSAGMFECSVNNGTLEVLLPKDLVDTTLFVDLLPYISPAGMPCRVVRKNQTLKGVKTKVGYSDTLYAKFHKDYAYDEEYKSSDLSGLFNVDDSRKPIFANYDNKVLNAGLLDNLVIPLLDGSGLPVITLKNEGE